MIYLAKYIGGGKREDPLRPEGVEGLSYGVTDLGDGECLVKITNPKAKSVEGLAISYAADLAKERLLHKILPTGAVKEIWCGGQLLYREPAEPQRQADPIDPSDDFNRADGVLNGAEWNESSNQIVIKSNRARLENNSFVRATHNTSAATADQFVQVKAYDTLTSWSNEHWIQIGLRTSDVGASLENTYVLAIRVTSGHHRLFYVDDGSYGELINDYSTGFTSGQTARIEAEGSTIRCFKDGTNISGSPVTDTRVDGGADTRRFTLAFVGDDPASHSVPEADDFLAGDIGGAAAAYPWHTYAAMMGE